LHPTGYLFKSRYREYFYQLGPTEQVLAQGQRQSPVSETFFNKKQDVDVQMSIIVSEALIKKYIQGLSLCRSRSSSSSLHEPINESDAELS
jgi:hypothetical protein